MRLRHLILIIELSALIFILYYKSRFWCGYAMVTYHMMVVTLGISGLLFLSFLASLLRSSKIAALANLFIAIIWSGSIFLLLICYAIILIGKKNGIGILPFTLLYSHLKSFNAISELIGISILTAYSFVSILLLLPVFSALFLNKIISRGINDLKVYMAPYAEKYRKKNLRYKLIILASAILFIVPAAMGLSRAYLKGKIPYIQEPLYAMVIGETHYMGMFHFSPYVEPLAVRKNYPKKDVFNKKNVILIIVDALRAENLSMYGYKRATSPFLQLLFEQKKIQYVNYSFSTSSGSFPGILSILRSKPINDLSYHNFSISELLWDQGYKVNYILSGDHTGWYNLRYFYGANIDFFFDGRFSDHYVCDDELLLEGLNKVKAYNGTPSFFYFHMMSVHVMGLRHQEFIKWTPAGIGRHAVSYRNNYDNGILQADSYIKRIFGELQTKGYLKNSIVIITADHGESLGERNGYGHLGNLYNEQIRIPLLIYDSDTSIHFDRRDFAEQPDIAATIIDRLGLPIPPSWEGKSLLADTFNTFTYHWVFDQYAIIHYTNDKIFKYYYHEGKNIEQLFELRRDVHEQHDIIHQANPTYITMLRAKMKDFLRSNKNQ